MRRGAVQSILMIPDCSKVSSVGEKEYKCRNMCQEVGDLFCIWHNAEYVHPEPSLVTQESELEIKPRPITESERGMLFHTFDVKGWEIPTGNQQLNARLRCGMRWLMACN